MRSEVILALGVLLAGCTAPAAPADCTGPPRCQAPGLGGENVPESADGANGENVAEIQGSGTVPRGDAWNGTIYVQAADAVGVADDPHVLHVATPAIVLLIVEDAPGGPFNGPLRVSVRNGSTTAIDVTDEPPIIAPVVVAAGDWSVYVQSVGTFALDRRFDATASWSETPA
jgi:hypothetical protein